MVRKIKKKPLAGVSEATPTKEPLFLINKFINYLIRNGKKSKSKKLLANCCVYTDKLLKKKFLISKHERASPQPLSGLAVRTLCRRSFVPSLEAASQAARPAASKKNPQKNPYKDRGFFGSVSFHYRDGDFGYRKTNTDEQPAPGPFEKNIYFTARGPSEARSGGQAATRSVRGAERPHTMCEGPCKQKKTVYSPTTNKKSASGAGGVFLGEAAQKALPNEVKGSSYLASPLIQVVYAGRKPPFGPPKKYGPRRLRNSNTHTHPLAKEAIGFFGYSKLLFASVAAESVRREGGRTKKPFERNFQKYIKRKLTPFRFFQKAISRVRPLLSLQKLRKGGRTRYIPKALSAKKGMFLAIKWVINSSSLRRQGAGDTTSRPHGTILRCTQRSRVSQTLANELWDCFLEQGYSWQKKEELHKLGAANKAFIRYNWW